MLATPMLRAQMLDVLVRDVISDHPRLLALQKSVLAAEAELEIPEASKGVLVYFEGGVGAQRPYGGQFASALSPTLRLRKLAYDSGRNDRELQVRQARVNEAREALGGGREDLAMDIAEAYVRFARSRDLVSATEQWLRGLESIELITREIQSIDRGRQVDLVHASSRVERARVELVVRRSALSEAGKLLDGLTGRLVKVESSDSLVALVRVDPFRMDGVLDGHPRVRVADAGVDVARSQAALEALYDRPSIDFEVYASGGRDLYGTYRALNSVGVQLLASHAVFDGGVGVARSVASDRRYAQAEAEAAAVRREVRTMYERYLSAGVGRFERMKGFEFAYASAKDLGGRMSEQFRSGRRPVVDLLSQEAEIYQSAVSLLNERYDAVLLDVHMAHAAGRLLHVLKVDGAARDHTR